MRTERWQWVMGIAAILLLLVAISIDHPFFSTAIGEGSSYIFNVHSVVLLCTELAFALIIALAISMGIERQARNRDHQTHDRMRRVIAEDVFKGVFAEGLPRAYIEAVVDRNLRVQVVRPWVRTVENLSELGLEGEGLSRQAKSLLKLDRTVEFELENVSGHDIVENARFFAPIKIPEVLDLTKVSLISIDGIDIDRETLESYRRLERNETSVAYEWPIPIKRGKKVHLRLEATIFKNRQDNEVWSTVYPTLKFELIFRSSVPLRRLGMRDRPLAPLTSEYCDAEKGIGNWVIEGPLLPNDTITIFWSCPAMR